MKFLLEVIALAAAIMGALIWGRRQARLKARSANALVLGAIDGRLLWRGVGLGSAVTVAVITAQAVAPWLTWSWGETPSDVLPRQASLAGTTATWAWFVAMIVLPFSIMVVMPDVVLFRVALDVDERRMGWRGQRPVRTFVAVSVVGVAMSLPLVGVLLYATITVMLKRGLRVDVPSIPDAEIIVTDDDRALLEPPPCWRVLRPTGRLAREGKKDVVQDLLDKSWRALPLVVRRQVARVAATHVVAMMAIFVTDQSIAIVTGEFL